MYTNHTPRLAKTQHSPIQLLYTTTSIAYYFSTYAVTTYSVPTGSIIKSPNYVLVTDFVQRRY